MARWWCFRGGHVGVGRGVGGSAFGYACGRCLVGDDVEGNVLAEIAYCTAGDAVAY